MCVALSNTPTISTIMNNIIIKKRRPYCHDDDPAEPVLQDPSHSSLTGFNTSSLSTQQQYILDRAASTQVRLSIPLSKLLDIGRQDSQHYILEQAASVLNVPAPHLLDLAYRRQHQHHKRPRFQPELPMPSSPFSGSPDAQDAREKLPLSGRHTQGSNDSRRALAGFGNDFPSGWTSSRLAECLSSFAMCPPCSTYDSQPAYQPIPTTAPYEAYSSSGPPLIDTSGSMQGQSRGSFDSSQLPTGHPGLFACDDPSIIAQCMQTYPPLQPTRIMGTQPSTSREGMVYPGSPSNPKYLNGIGETRDATGLGIQGHPQLMSPTDTNDAMAAAFAGDMSCPPLARQTSLVGLAPRYDMLQDYGQPDSLVKNDPEALELQARSSLDCLFPHQRVPSARRGPFKDHDQRERTAHTRRIGSCIRCRMQRIRCNLDPVDENGPCLTCKKVANNRVWRLSCLRWKITDVRLFKPGQVKGHEWTNRWKDSVVDDIGSWVTSETRTIQVTEGYTGKFVELRVRRFQPQEGDRVDRSWVSDGVKKSVTIPPFAIVDMESAKSAFDDYIKKGLVDCCKRLLGPREKLLWRTYSLAMKIMGDASTHPKERELLSCTLDLWMSIRLTTKSFEIVGDETLGMSHDLINDQTNPLHGKIPLPPVMGAQIDSVLIHQVQHNLRRKTLEELQKMTQEKKQKTWLTTYLVTFILLHNLALITKHDAEYASKHGMKTRFAREEKVKEYNLGANTLLAYFHYCNKGMYPFSGECRDQDLQSLAALDESGIRFVHYTRSYYTDHKRQWERLWESDDYENEYYYVSQLFEQNWQPRTMV